MTRFFALRPVLRGLTIAAAVTAGGALPALSAGEGPGIAEHTFSFDGPFGTFDRAALQRGFQVYNEVCASCHSLSLLSYRNLGEPGGPEFSEAAVEAIAAEHQVPAGPDEFGDILDADGFLRMRPALPSDKFASPFQNEQAARAANGGALPPDLSVITKARHHGAHYLYSLMVGYPEESEKPACIGDTPGYYYNKYFAAGQVPDSCKDEHGHATIQGSLIAMPPPLMPDRVTYADGTEASVAQMSSDVSTFLAWAAEPHMEARKRLGTQVMLYLAILTGFLYLSYRQVWSNVEH
ncbi:MAG: cytochrome c1 [Pseudomonadota bacterium]|nr:cytochrome c1 [Pseudomonadota bacterium]